MVSDRLALPKMRKKQKALKETASTEQIKKAIESDILQYGVSEFPGEFLQQGTAKKFIRITTTGKPLRIGDYFFGKFSIVDEDGQQVFDANGIEEAKFIVYAYSPNDFEIRLPQNPKASALSVAKYERYIKDLQEKIMSRALAATNDYHRAEQITSELLSEFNVSKIDRH